MRGSDADNALGLGFDHCAEVIPTQGSLVDTPQPIPLESRDVGSSQLSHAVLQTTVQDPTLCNVRLRHQTARRPLAKRLLVHRPSTTSCRCMSVRIFL